MTKQYFCIIFFSTLFFQQAKDKWESTPLQSACSVGSIAIVKRLLKSGARVDVVNEAHNSPLHLGCSGGHEAVSAIDLLKFFIHKIRS